MTPMNVMKPNLENYALNSSPVSENSGSGESVRKTSETSLHEQVEKFELNQLSGDQKTNRTEVVLDPKTVEKTLSDLNQQMEVMNNYLRFEKDEDTNKMVIFIRDTETDEVIRQIPSDEFLAISKNISKYLEMRQQLSETVAVTPGLITDIKA